MGSKHGKPILRKEDIDALAATTGLEETQIKKTFEEFVTKHPDGKISKDVFHKMMAQALPEKDAVKMEKNVFRLYDTNGDGCIDFTEFMTTFHIMADGTPEEVLSKIFRVFDVNGDGFITIKEMRKLTTDLYGLLKAKDPNVAATDLIAKTAFAEMDKDLDGRVSVTEFISACMAQEAFSQMLTSKILDIFVED